MSFADRLKHAINVRGSIREFHKQIAQKDVAGSSYPVIHRYLKGDVTPPLEFVEAAAEVLKVRPSWLAFAEGSMTEAQAAARVQEQASQEDIDKRTQAAMREHFRYYNSISTWALGPVWEVIRRLMMDQLIRRYGWEKALEVVDHDLAVEAATSVAKILGAPLEPFAVDDVNMDTVSRYAVEMSQALMILVPPFAERAKRIKGTDSDEST